MRRITRCGWLLVAILSATPAWAGKGPTALTTAQQSPRERLGDGWPDTRAGRIARRWVTAFGTGEKAMREFYAADLAAEELAKRGMDRRIEKYLELREKFGSLTSASVVESKPSELKVSLLDADATPHEFVFKIQTRKPYRLLSVGMLERSHGHGGFHH